MSPQARPAGSARRSFRPWTGTPPAAQIVWREGIPESTVFGDVYSTRAGALAQARAVFLAGCDLPQAFGTRQSWCLLELGFGAGINFLATRDLWCQTRAPGAVLHYVAIEGFPLDPDDARRMHAAEPALSALSESLLAHWPARTFGLQRLWFDEDGICLSLMVAPVEEALAALQCPDDDGPAEPGPVSSGQSAPPIGAFRADGVFLDGFAPAKNPAMWSPEVLGMVARLCAADARLASYSVAGTVRRTLAGLGFAAVKAPGLGAKKQRLAARRTGPTRASPPRPTCAIVIGAGIAGASAAFAFARRGLQVTVFDAREEPGASFNPAALVHPRLDAVDTPARRLHIACFLFARALYRRIGAGAFEETGICVQPGHPAEAARFAKIALAPPLGPEWLGFEGGALLHRRGGVVRPSLLLPALLAQAEVHRSRPIGRVLRVEGEWHAFDEQGDFCARAPLLVVAPGARPNAATDGLPMDRIAGQVDWAEWSGEGLRFSPAGERYAIALDGKTLLYGATYDRLPADAAEQVTPGPDASARNLAGLMKLSPVVAAALGAHLGARASIRAAFADQLPAFGFPCGFGEESAHDRHSVVLIAGLGSRGYSLAPLLGEAAASLLLGEPMPLEPAILAALSPRRFAERAARRIAKD